MRGEASGRSGGQPRIEVRRSSDRFATDVPGRTTRHLFSFDRHYDPAEVSLGFLVCHNEDRVAPGHGYPPHPHRDLEIVTWVLGGCLRHEDSTGRGGTVVPGVVQRLSAGSGVVHTEVTEGDQPVHFVQMWVLPDEPGRSPDYAQSDVHAELDGGRWLTLASGLRSQADRTAVRLGNSRAALHVIRLGPGHSVPLPDAGLMHLFVARGDVDVEGVPSRRLGEGDAAKLFASGGRGVAAGTEAELLVWEMHPT